MTFLIADHNTVNYAKFMASSNITNNTVVNVLLE